MFLYFLLFCFANCFLFLHMKNTKTCFCFKFRLLFSYQKIQKYFNLFIFFFLLLMFVYIHLLYFLFISKCFVRFSFIFFYAPVNSVPRQLCKSPKVEQQWNATFNITHTQNILSRTTIALIPKSGYVGIRSRGLNEHNLVYIF